MPRDFHDPWEPEDIFDHGEAQERRARLDAAAADNAAFEKHESEQAAVRKENARQLSMRANASMLLAEYRAAGVEPPFVTGEGVPTVSLSMLKRLGWSVMSIDGVNSLVRTAHVSAAPMSEYDGNTQ